MCDLCQHYPCATNCPNYEEKPVCCCDKCGEDIFAGDIFYEIKIEGFLTQNLCEDCIEDSKKYAEHDLPDEDDYDKYETEEEYVETV
jgi:hypothetical protein